MGGVGGVGLGWALIIRFASLTNNLLFFFFLLLLLLLLF